MAIGFAQSELALRTLRVLEDLVVLPRRLSLSLSPETTPDESEMQRLRGVWGAALHELDMTAYEAVFHPSNSIPPKYILRPAGRSAEHSPSFDFILIGAGIRFDESALRAWDIASGMGLGKARRQFHVRSRSIIDAVGRPAKSKSAWPVTKACWPLPGTPETSPCTLHFQTPLALHHDRNLIEQPTLKDIVAKGCRRIESLLAADRMADWQQLKGDLIGSAADVVSIPRFQEPLGIARYSGSQRRDFPIACVAGRLDLPEGPSATWPLLAALQWVHVGKGTNIGLGRVDVSSTNLRAGF
ncbi:MAG: CRISPR system precrRNA processing endoribonuclease RAMP protein Cas6 [Planctomycetota bacterium]